MTPREIAGALFFAERRRRLEAAERLALDALATRGDPRELKKQIADLQRD
jgi:hypothetical protein